MKNKEIFIHIGFPRTGTTFLQEEIFPNLDKNEIRIISHSDNSIVKDLLEKIVLTNTVLNPINEQLIQKVEQYLSDIEQKKILISFEGLTGDVFNNHLPYVLISENLKKIFPKAKILLVIRKQDELIKSYYLYSLYEGHHKTLKQFINYHDGKFGDFVPVRFGGVNVDIKNFNYFNYIYRYEELFGREKVQIVPFELIKKENKQYLDKIYDFLMLDNRYYPHKPKVKNRGFSLISVYISVIFNRFIINKRNGCGFIVEQPFFNFFDNKYNKSNKFIYKLLRAISSRLTLKYFLQNLVDKVIYIKPDIMDDKIKHKILDQHKESNLKLSDKYDLDLGKLGYFNE